jgi:hypothetical protein
MNACFVFETAEQISVSSPSVACKYLCWMEPVRRGSTLGPMGLCYMQICHSQWPGGYRACQWTEDLWVQTWPRTVDF